MGPAEAGGQRAVEYLLSAMPGGHERSHNRVNLIRGDLLITSPFLFLVTHY